MIPDDLVGQPLEVMVKRGFHFNDMSIKQKADAQWWDEHYKNAHELPLQALADERYKAQNYKAKQMTFISGKMPVWSKDGT